jgi:endoglucanase
VRHSGDWKKPFSYGPHMLSAPPAPYARPTDPSPGPHGSHRAQRGRRLLWTSGLAAALVGAGLVTPLLTAPETSSAVQPAIEQVRKDRPAHPRTTTPVPATSDSTTSD